MKKTPKKKMTVDTKNYVSDGKGVSTRELIRNAAANDETWSTADGDEEIASIRLKPLHYRINLISADTAQKTSEYLEKVSLESVFLPAVRKLNLFKNKALFKNYKENKDKIKKQIREEAMAVYKNTKDLMDDVVIMVIDKQELITKDVTDIFLQELNIKETPASRKLIDSLSEVFIDAFTDIDE